MSTGLEEWLNFMTGTSATGSSILTPDGYANVTMEIYRPMWSSTISMANSAFFLLCYTMYFICLTVFLTRLKMKGIVIKRNPKILFALGATFVGIQTLNLLARVIFDGMNMKGRTIAESGGMVTYTYFVVMIVIGSLSTFFLLGNILFLFVILYFCQSIFWKTAYLIRAISKRTHTNITLITNIISPFLFAGVILLIFAVTVIHPLNGIGMISSIGSTVVYIGCFVLFIVLLLYYVSMVLSSGIMIVKTIRKSSVAVKNASANSSHNPLAITFALLVGLIVCLIIELLAFGIGSIVTLRTEDYKAIWHFFNCGGVLVFAVIILLLFYPMFVNTEQVVRQYSDIESQCSGKRRRDTLKTSIPPLSETTDSSLIDSGTPSGSIVSTQAVSPLSV